MLPTTAQSVSLRQLERCQDHGTDVIPFSDQSHRPLLVVVRDARSGDGLIRLAELAEAVTAFLHPYGYTAPKGIPASPALRPAPPSNPSQAGSN